MKRIAVFLSGFFLLINHNFAQQNYIVTAPLNILQLINETGERFDLSGMTSYQGKIFVIADKPFNHYIYEIKTANHYFSVIPVQDFHATEPMDLEGIVSDAEGGFYLCDERNSGVRYAHPVKEIFDVLPLKWPDSENMNHWKNRGLEGIALDVKTNRLFLAKERQPQKLFEVDADGFQVQQIAQQITEASQFDISDLFYENGFLYLLNRAGFRILKMDLETSDVTDTLDYRRVMFHNQTLMYAGARYAMAEALIFNEQEIWIGLDNNAEPVNSDNKWMKMYNFEGTNPVIVVIERPEGF